MPRAKSHDWDAARKLRRSMSLPEVLLWRLLKGQPQGLKFRRQHPVGSYVLDFYCPAAKLGFELDGIAHDIGTAPHRDPVRDARIGEYGIQIVRIPASEVLKSATNVAEAMIGECRKRN